MRCDRNLKDLRRKGIVQSLSIFRQVMSFIQCRRDTCSPPGLQKIKGSKRNKDRNLIENESQAKRDSQRGRNDIGQMVNGKLRILRSNLSDGTNDVDIRIASNHSGH